MSSGSADRVSPAIPSPKGAGRRTATLVLLGAVAAVNSFALLAAWQDQSWFAFYTAVYFAPILNLCLAGGFLAHAVASRRKAGFPLARQIVLSLLAPAAMAGLDAVVILRMPLHGC